MNKYIHTLNIRRINLLIRGATSVKEYHFFKYSFLLLLASLCLIASAQSNTISLNCKNEKMANAINMVGKQSDYAFVFKASILKDSKPVNVQLKNVSLAKALEEIFKGQPLIYE